MWPTGAHLASLWPTQTKKARFTDLGPDWHARKGDRDRKIRTHLRQLQALGLDVTITPPPKNQKPLLTRPVTQAPRAT